MARLFWIAGHVQGVGFREHTRKQARRLALVGYAMNLPDGRVEVLACGAQAAIDELASWLNVGSPQGRVDQVDSVETRHDETLSSFQMGWLPGPSAA